MKSNVILIGMPGVGKSTLGVILAKLLCYKFIDTDILIQEEESSLLSEIIDKKGVDGFIKVENDIVSKISVDNTVIATGGSVIYGEDAMNTLKNMGEIIYLKQDLERIQSRIENIHGRGVALKQNQTFEELYNERIILYEKYADIVVEQGNLGVEETLNIIIQNLKEKK